MKLSIVTTLYNSAAYIEEFYLRMSRSAQNITSDYEIIFVNDGSFDKSLQIVHAIFQKDPHVIVVDLSRNFGHHKAIMTGLSYVKGDFVFLIDVDLEEKPELLDDYWNKMKSDNNIDVVYGLQLKRKGKFFKKITGWFFYIFLNFLSAEKMPRNISLSRLMTRRYVESLVLFKEREIYLGGLWHIAGYEQVAVPIKKSFKGTTSYTFLKKISLLVNAITSFSDKPLVFIFHVGLVVFSVAFFSSIFTIIKKVFYKYIVTGWTSLIISIWLLGGLVILFLGIIGIYLSKIFIETKQRPYTIIKKIYKHKGD